MGASSDLFMIDNVVYEEDTSDRWETCLQDDCYGTRTRSEYRFYD